MKCTNMTRKRLGLKRMAGLKKAGLLLAGMMAATMHAAITVSPEEMAQDNKWVQQHLLHGRHGNRPASRRAGDARPDAAVPERLVALWRARCRAGLRRQVHHETNGPGFRESGSGKTGPGRCPHGRGRLD